MKLPFSYHLRNLFVRKLSSALTFLVVAVIVFVLAVLLSFAAGIRSSLAAGGTDRNIIVMARGATAESTSILMPADAARLVQTPGIARREDGQLLISPEVIVQTGIPRRDAERNMANVAVRGVDDTAFKVHEGVRVIEGRPFQQGALEAIVGKAAQVRYENLGIGDEIPLGRSTNRLFRIVGFFEAGGGALESEIWAPRGLVADAYARRFLSSSVIRLAEGALATEAVQYIEGPSVGLAAKTEIAYYDELSSKTREIVVLATALVSIMAVGAIFAVANTMYSAVDGRRREIAMLRTIGFPRRTILFSFTFESVLLCIPACLAGLGAARVLSGSRRDYLSDATWTVLAFELIIDFTIVAASLGLATLVGVVGAMAPALKAVRTPVIEALRKA